jgi:hypothetical protein
MSDNDALNSSDIPPMRTSSIGWPVSDFHIQDPQWGARSDCPILWDPFRHEETGGAFKLMHTREGIICFGLRLPAPLYKQFGVSIGADAIDRCVLAGLHWWIISHMREKSRLEFDALMMLLLECIERDLRRAVNRAGNLPFAV